MFLQDINHAIDILKNNQLLIYPTETFFALGCKISSEQAIADVFKFKKRLLAMPLPVIIANINQVPLVALLSSSLQDDVEFLAKEFWPGPLSLILPARVTLSPLLTGGTGRIAIRQSSHPVATELAQKLGEPLVSSSANISGILPVTKITEMDTTFMESIGAVLDLAPAPNGGLASTIIEPKGNKEVLVHRKGSVDLERIRNCGFICTE